MRRNTRHLDSYDRARYEWEGDVREYTDRIRHGPVKETDLTNQTHMNLRVIELERALNMLRDVLPAGPVYRAYEAVTIPLRLYLKMVTVARALYAEPEPDVAAGLFRSFYGRK